MKLFYKKFLFIIFAASMLFYNGCDELSELALNVPIVIEFSASGPDNSVTESEFFCLSDYDEWRDNQDDIESAQYVASSYWTFEEGTTANLMGNVTFALYDSGNNLIFSVGLGTITAADYIDEPFELALTVEDIEALNAILADLPGNDGCFNATMLVTNITGDKNMSGNYVLNGKVEIVLEATVQTD